MGVLFSAASREFEIIRDDWLRSLEEIAARGAFVGGPPVARFEQAFAGYIGTSEAIGVGNGTDSLYLILKALGVGPGDEVITAANTFIATVEAIHHTGATPVLADCRSDDFLIDAEQVRRRITSRTKAILPVHLYGQIADMDEILDIARERGIHVVEDSAQAAGARRKGKAAGSFGIAGSFSFYPDKNLGAIGDGGGIVTSDAKLAASVRKLRNHGGEVRYQHDVPGFNSRLDPIQAAALELKLKHLDEWNRARRQVAGWYEHYLGPIGGIELPRHRGDESHAFHVYVVRVDEKARDRVRKQLQKKGVLTAVHYPLPVHLTPAFRHLGHQAGDYPVSEAFAGQILSLPMNIAVREEDVALIARELASALGAIHV
ncbi:hypothetical protein J19TS2_32800 [Cohnella xylanilytica]|uniref:DegT/DnrJ/EryC1/StrS family aminotransferase n=1 Tax=Cohnella xylanilytica TaxID=557555 RepID=A0A841TRZ2_9BACL|nr:DegT/DnrJ/EryC1/StrS family aminotransferase [Cohnella xylanilytica]MBB6690925.1 DegT/DnrJ/EryC1/StrS family aminotransferase [Cohnella xylanilytica]GIO13725.1 hypothetical protein J19TS2_32800 [Cohnella xylanilytica]